MDWAAERTGYPHEVVEMALAHAVENKSSGLKMVTRIKVALPTTYPYQTGFATLAGQIAKLVA